MEKNVDFNCSFQHFHLLEVLMLIKNPYSKFKSNEKRKKERKRLTIVIFSAFSNSSLDDGHIGFGALSKTGLFFVVIVVIFFVMPIVVLDVVDCCFSVVGYGVVVELVVEIVPVIEMNGVSVDGRCKLGNTTNLL